MTVCVSTEVQTDMDVCDFQQLEKNSVLAERLMLTENAFECCNDEFVKFYTGLPCYSRLKAVFNLVCGSSLSKHPNSSLPLVRFNTYDKFTRSGFRFSV